MAAVAPAWRPGDDHTIAWASADGLVTVEDADTAKVLRTLPQRRASASSPGPATAASCSSPARTPRHRSTTCATGTTRRLAAAARRGAAARGLRSAAATGSRWQVRRGAVAGRSAFAGRPLPPPPTSGSTILVWSPDGRWLPAGRPSWRVSGRSPTPPAVRRCPPWWSSPALRLRHTTLLAGAAGRHRHTDFPHLETPRRRARRPRRSPRGWWAPRRARGIRRAARRAPIRRRNSARPVLAFSCASVHVHNRKGTVVLEDAEAEQRQHGARRRGGDRVWETGGERPAPRARRTTWPRP